ncbi:MAG: hypothetical protein OCC49_14150 [Fibrobacterales bacterium]
MISLTPSITALPVVHGKVAFSNYLRDELLNQSFDCIAIELPPIVWDEVHAAIEALPIIQAVVMKYDNYSCFIPIDPCDSIIEAARQGMQNNIPIHCIDHNDPPELTETPYLPDPYAITKIGFDDYYTLCKKVLQKATPKVPSRSKLTRERMMAQNLLNLEKKYSNILVVCGMNHILGLEKLIYANAFSDLKNSAPLCTITRFPINPNHLYFCLGELPFYTGLHEMSRHDIFAERPDLPELIKRLFIDTREQFVRDSVQGTRVSPHRIQTALTYIRNLTYLNKRLSPGLIDIIDAAKGVFDDRFALNVLKAAKHYPFINPEDDQTLGVGLGQIKEPFGESEEAENLFADLNLEWKTLKLKQDPAQEQKKEYRYTWNPYSMCSHLPEDTRIENFNSHIRRSALKQLSALNIKSEEFLTSVKDGIDIRETLRNWHTKKIYVKEIPPGRSHIDTVVIIFDDANDINYPHQTVWFAEHAEESTLTFFGTDPMNDLIGPGVARAQYGGLSLLFPPRPVNNPFGLEGNTLAEQLLHGACVNAADKNIAYVSARKPTPALNKIARKYKKNLIWMPFAKFSTETLNQLRTFHVLNDKEVRTIATRFIGF